MKKSKMNLAMLLFLCVVGGIIAFIIIDIIQFKASSELDLHHFQRKLVTLCASISVAGGGVIVWSELKGLQK